MEKEAGNSVHSDIEEDITLLKQLTDALDEAEQRLEEFYKKEDAENLNKAKKFMLDVCGKIKEISE